jgi:hypothetical protein
MFDEKPPLEELAHFGVLGMKWGHRKSATRNEIVGARRRLKEKSAAYKTNYKKLDALPAGSRKKVLLENTLRRQHHAYLKNPDRVIAARMTRGEKFTSLLFAAESGPGITVSLASIAATSAASRRIEYKQDTGAYNKKPTGKVQKSIGFQKGRTVALLGASVTPAILSAVGPTLAVAIGKRAAGKRAAAKAASGATAIGSAAQKLKYAKMRRGVATITTLK